MKNILTVIYSGGYAGLFYYGFHVLGFLGVGLFVARNAPKMGISKKTAVLTVAVVYPLLYLWNMVICWVEHGFTNFGSNNIVRLFVYLPLALYPASKVNKVPYTRLCQLIAPVPCIAHGISHLGCVFEGCCRGYPCPWGLYNVYTQERCFPSQWLEAFVALAIVGMLQIRSRKRNWGLDSRAMPLMLFSFGGTRFFLEFLRDNTKLFWNISDLALHALFCALVGGVWLLRLRGREDPVFSGAGKPANPAPRKKKKKKK